MHLRPKSKKAQVISKFLEENPLRNEKNKKDVKLHKADLAHESFGSLV